MKIEELQKKGAIYFERVDERMEGYTVDKIVLPEVIAENHFKSLRDQYGLECSYTDFYYYVLGEESQKMVHSILSQEEMEYLQSHVPEEIDKDIIFPLDDQLLSIVVKLNAQGMLFSTIYFIENKEKGLERMSWWGNYNQEYIWFRDKE